MWIFLCSHFLFRNKETKRDDFVFFTNRLACLIIEYALSFLSFKARACMYLHDQFILMYAELSLHCLCQYAGRECGNTPGEHLWGEEIWWKGTCVCCRWTNRPPPLTSTIFAMFILPYIYWMTVAVWCVHHESWGGPRTSSDVRLQGCHPWKDTHTDQWGHWWTRGIIICVTLWPARDSS